MAIMFHSLFSGFGFFLLIIFNLRPDCNINVFFFTSIIIHEKRDHYFKKIFNLFVSEKEHSIDKFIKAKAIVCNFGLSEKIVVLQLLNFEAPCTEK